MKAHRFFPSPVSTLAMIAVVGAFACGTEDPSSTKTTATSGAGGTTATSGPGGSSSTGMPMAGSATLRFQNVFDGQPLEIGTQYMTADNEPFRYAMIRYWVSNVVLSGPAEHPVTDGYFLVEQTTATTRSDITIENIPPGEYHTVTFGLGVDAAHNHSTDVFVGELSTAVDMDWGWNSGFVFVKTEGDYFNDGSQALTPFSAHIGTDTNYKTVTLTLPEPFTVDGMTTPVITIELEASALPNGFDFNQADNITFGPEGPALMNIFAAWYGVATD